jgi:hypothetical protein
MALARVSRNTRYEGGPSTTCVIDASIAQAEGNGRHLNVHASS